MTVTPTAYPEQVKDESWIEDAACLGYPHAWFFTSEEGECVQEKQLLGRALCKSCVVRDECLDYAIRTGTHYGIFGGLTSRERKRLRARAV